MDHNEGIGKIEEVNGQYPDITTSRRIRWIMVESPLRGQRRLIGHYVVVQAKKRRTPELEYQDVKDRL